MEERRAVLGLSSVKLVARVLSFTFTLISLVILTPFVASNSVKHESGNVFSYRYMLFSIILGLVYSLLQIAVSIYSLRGGAGARSLVPLDFYGDLVILYALATGAVAGFGATDSDTKRMVDVERDGLLFVEKGDAAATFLFIASLFSAISLVFSAHDLQKRRYFMALQATQVEK